MCACVERIRCSCFPRSHYALLTSSVQLKRDLYCICIQKEFSACGRNDSLLLGIGSFTDPLFIPVECASCAKGGGPRKKVNVHGRRMHLEHSWHEGPPGFVWLSNLAQGGLFITLYYFV